MILSAFPESVQILWNIIVNLFTWFLYLFPFGIFDNITAFFPQAYENPFILLALWILSTLFGFIFLVYLSTILLLPTDDDVKSEGGKGVPYRRTFLGQTIRFVLGSKNVVTYSGVLMKFVNRLGMKLIPLVLVFSFVYFPIMPGAKGFFTVGGFTETNLSTLTSAIDSIVSGNFASGSTSEESKRAYSEEKPEIRDLKSSEYVSKKLITKYQGDAGVKASIDANLKKFADKKDISGYDAAIEGFATESMPTLIQDSSKNPEIEKNQQIVYGTLAAMHSELLDRKKKAEGKQPIVLPGGKIHYTGLKVETLGYFLSALDFVFTVTWVIFLILLSGWKNLLIMYLYVCQIILSKFESLKNKDFVKKITATNAKMKELGTDIKEWEFIVENGQYKEAYLILTIEILVRFAIVYYIIYF